MKFTLDNEIREHYVENFKPFQLNSVVVSAGGFEFGFSDSFLSLIDSGAKTTCISSKRMKRILRHVRDKNGKPLQPTGKVGASGVFGSERESLVYILPHFYLGKIHFTDLVVTVLESDNFDCLVGRSILHQCIATYDPKANQMHFDFDPSLEQSKQKILDIVTFGSVELFAEF